MRNVVPSALTPLAASAIAAIGLLGCAPSPLNLSFADDRDLRTLSIAEENTYCIEVATWVAAHSTRETYLDYRCTLDALEFSTTASDCVDARARCLADPPDYLHVETCVVIDGNCTPTTARFFEQCITEDVFAWPGRAAYLSCDLAGNFPAILAAVDRYPSPTCAMRQCEPWP
jgi:hypothetical protein